MHEPYAYIYGPVPSRRLGRSLGVDVSPLKICSFDCIYCQLGRTTQKTLERREYVPTVTVLDELRRKLAEGDQPDCISFAGSGEPTLHSGLGEIIQAIKGMCDVPVAVFTNGSLLWRPDVCADLSMADIVVPTLDAYTPAQLEQVNRCAEGLEFEHIIQGLIHFRDVFAGQIWLEVFLLGGINDDDVSVNALAALATQIRPDKVQLNTVCRPPAESFAKPVCAERLQDICKKFSGCVEVAAAHNLTLRTNRPCDITEEDVLALIERHPSTDADAAKGLGIAPEQAVRLLRALVMQNKVVVRPVAGVVYYAAAQQQAL